MSDSDPRPMPPEVKQAYNDTIELRGLLMSSVYSEQDRRAVLDALMRSLIAKYGDVWIEAGSKEVRVSTRVKQTKKNVANAIQLLYRVEEYGGRESIDLMLASEMETLWSAWWESFVWEPRLDPLLVWAETTSAVLGPRQSTWLAAQYARTVIDLTRARVRDVCLAAIETAESWALVPSDSNRLSAYSALGRIQLSAYYFAFYTAEDAALSAAARVFYENPASTLDYLAASSAAKNAAMTAQAVAYAASRSTSASTPLANFEEAMVRLAELTRSLIRPTLVTRASRGLRASGGTPSRAAPAVLGLAAGAGAVLLAKRV